jgi:outer membrane receptor protein involved in Fe transport
MTVVSGEKLDAYNINHLDDLSSLVPSLSISQAATVTRIFLRGVGSGGNQGFEQSVGTFVDDIYYARPRQLRLPLFDTEQIEVLRGPQGTLFGKNTVVGAINIKTREPTDYFYSEFSSLYEIEDDEYQASGVVSGPLTETLRARLSLRAGGMDGFLDNSYNGNEEPQNDYYTVRGKFQWLPLDKLDISAKYERNELDVDGRSIQIIEAGPSLPLFTAFDPSFEDQLDEHKGQVFDL